MKKPFALLIVDVQNDFCPGGNLAVPKGDTIIPVLNKYIEAFAKADCPIFASRDWHPLDTPHFQGFGGNWPVHCVKNTVGAEFHANLKLPASAIVISKGMGTSDGYSAFQGKGKDDEPFIDLLKLNEVETLFIGGLATDYCVKASALEAREEGFTTYFLGDASRGVNLHPEDSALAIKEMVAKGIEVVDFRETLQMLG